MQTIPIAQLEEMFAALRTQESDIDGEMLWGYYFTSPEAEALEPLAEELEELGYEVSDIFHNEEENLYLLQAERVEAHTPESLFALNTEHESRAARYPGVEYDGMDVNSGEEHGCCGGQGGEGCGCGHSEQKAEEHECCGGHGHHHAEEEAQGCCGGHGHHHEEEEERGCCGGHGHSENEGCGCGNNQRHEEAEEEAHGCCGGGGHSHGGGGCCGGGGNAHVHREGEPISNPQILMALDRISKDHSEDSQREMTLALQRGLYLVPVFSGRIDTEPTDDQAVQVLVCTDEKNNEFLPLFTDEEALKTWTQENVSGMVLTAPEAWDFILTQAECAGGVINPGSSALPLSREMVEILKKMIDDHQRQTA